MKRQTGFYVAVLTAAALIGILSGAVFALERSYVQLDPTAQEMTVQALVNGYFTQTAEAPLVATAQARFNEALIATAVAQERGINRDFTDGALETIALPHAFGARKGFWQVLFSVPIASTNRADYVGGMDTQLAAAVDRTQKTLDIAAFEWDNVTLEEAVLQAHRRGVKVRVVTDDEFGVCKIKINPNSKNAAAREAELQQCLAESGILRFQAAGIPVVDDNRSGLMHNKFMIMDGQVVWMGSMNYTFTGSYKNNENLLALRSPQAVAAYQGEFNEMFEQNSFGRRSPQTNSATFEQDGAPIQVLFASEDPVNTAIIDHLREAKTSIRFLAFSFTLDEMGDVMLQKALDGVNVAGVFEWKGSGTEFSELSSLFCANLEVRRDGNVNGKLHDKIIIVDDEVVMTGSFNFSANATLNNDENMVIIKDRDLAAQYLQAFNRIWEEARIPEGIGCATGIVTE